MSNTMMSGQSDRTRLFMIWFLAWLGATAHMFGEFLREAAVLFIIFVPLELWAPKTGLPPMVGWWPILVTSFLLLILGMGTEYVSLGALRVKRDLEGVNGDE